MRGAATDEAATRALCTTCFRAIPAQVRIAATDVTCLLLAFLLRAGHSTMAKGATVEAASLTGLAGLALCFFRLLFGSKAWSTPSWRVKLPLCVPCLVDAQEDKRL